MEQTLTVQAQITLVLVGGAIGLLSGLSAALAPEFLRIRAERKTLAASIVAEVQAILALIERRQYIERLRVVLARAEAEKNPLVSYSFSFTVRYDPFAVYHANLSRIGLLRSPPANLVVQFYTGATAVLEDVADFESGALAQAGRDESIVRLEALLELSARVKEIGEHIVCLGRGADLS